MSNRLALGTVQFGLEYGIANESGRVDFSSAQEILRKASDNNIDLLDTAIDYGESEKLLGQLCVSQWKVVSKLPALPKECADVAGWVESHVSGSLKRIGLDCLYGLLLHRPDQLLGDRGHELRHALESVKKQGRARKVGISIYDPDELGQLLDLLDVDIVQAPLNILDRRLVNSGWSKQLKRQGIELHARSIFLQGLLLMPATRRRRKFERWQSLWIEWDSWLEKNRLTPLQACIRYALSVTDVDKIIVGVDSVIHLEEIIDAAVDGAVLSSPNWPQNIDIDLLNPGRWNQL